jgi:HD-like signal output (HDOD) protein
MGDTAKPLGLNDAGELLKGVSIPPRPQLILDIREVYPNLRKIADLIQTDQGVSAGVLKAINSPLYGLQTRVVSIHRAVYLLGLTSVSNIVNGLLLRSALFDKGLVNELKSYWECTTDTAIVAGSITRQLRLGSSDQAYLLGLFHNCGIPLLMRKFKTYPRAIPYCYRLKGGSVTHVEDTYYETNHAEVGYFISRYWKLPDSVCNAIRNHHNLSKLSFAKDVSVDDESDTLLAILKMAEHIVKLHKRLGNVEEDFEWEKISEAVLGFVGIDGNGFSELIDMAHADLAEYSENGVKLED